MKAFHFSFPKCAGGHKLGIALLFVLLVSACACFSMQDAFKGKIRGLAGVGRMILCFLHFEAEFAVLGGSLPVKDTF